MCHEPYMLIQIEFDAQGCDMREEELMLVKALYFLNMGEHEYAKKIGLSQKGV